MLTWILHDRSTPQCSQELNQAVTSSPTSPRQRTKVKLRATPLPSLAWQVFDAGPRPHTTFQSFVAGPSHIGGNSAKVWWGLKLDFATKNATQQLSKNWYFGIHRGRAMPFLSGRPSSQLGACIKDTYAVPGNELTMQSKALFHSYCRRDC